MTLLTEGDGSVQLIYKHDPPGAGDGSRARCCFPLILRELLLAALGPAL